MKGTISFRHTPGDDFTPKARPNSVNERLVYVTLSEETEILLDDADEARAYAAAFTRAAAARGARQYAIGLLAFVVPCIKAGCAGRAPHDSHGTADCIKRARAHGIPVRRIEAAINA